MDTLIAYVTKYGCTESCAKILAEKLTGKVDLCNLKKAKDIDLSRYDKVIIGSSIYFGKVHKEASQFCIKNLNILKKKKMGIFICGMLKDNVEKEFNSSFAPEVLTNAVAKEFLGGEFKFKKMNPMEKFMVKRISKMDKSLPEFDVSQDVSLISEQAIDRFVELLNNA